jgi:hypothetical protein
MDQFEEAAERQRRERKVDALRAKQDAEREGAEVMRRTLSGSAIRELPGTAEQVATALGTDDVEAVRDALDLALSDGRATRDGEVFARAGSPVPR